MSGHAPPFDEIVGADDPERARLEATHELLVAAGPPPELPPSLETAPAEPRSRAIPFARRRFATIGAVAVAAAVLLGIGFALGGRDRPEEPVRTIAMTGPSGASASIDLLAKDAAGNWPMTLEVDGLPPLRDGGTYTLWLTRDGKLAEPCGAFAVGEGTTRVPLNAPYPLRQFDGWVVVRTGTEGPFLLRTDPA